MCFLRKKDRNSADKNITQTYITNQVDIDYDKLADAIVKANQRIEKEHDENYDKEWEVWRASIGVKDCKGNVVRQFINNLACFFRILIMGRKKAKTLNTTYLLIQYFTAKVFSLIKLFFYGFAIVMIVAAIKMTIDGMWIQAIVSMGLSVVLITIAALFRIAGYEIENLKKREEILAISSTVTAIVAAIIALVALLIGFTK